jgi:hypothetical protein
MSGPTLSEKVLALLDCIPESADVDLEPITRRVLARIDTQGRASYVLPDGAERHSQATLAEEARNFCEEIEDALAYAASAHHISGDPRWTAVPPVLAMLWQLAAVVTMDFDPPRRPDNVVGIYPDDLDDAA